MIQLLLVEMLKRDYNLTFCFYDSHLPFFQWQKWRQFLFPREVAKFTSSWLQNFLRERVKQYCKVYGIHFVWICLINCIIYQLSDFQTVLPHGLMSG